MDILDSATARAWIDVDLGALVANGRSLTERARPRLGIMPVVKADAYGLGVAEVVRALEALEPWGYAVATLAEGAELRDLGIKRRIVTLFSTPEELRGAPEWRLTPAIGDRQALGSWREEARRLGRRLPFQLEIDTGMGRAGFQYDEAQEWLPEVLEACAADLEWDATLTHFHTPESAGPTGRQWERFQTCLASFPEGIGGAVHAASSAAAIQWPEYSADIIRPGIFLYGGLEPGISAQPQPVVAVRARVLSVRDVAAGWTASYGADFVAPSDSRWATLAIGYGDGVRRELSKGGVVRFGEREAPIIGRVCMDVTVVDVTDLDGIEPGDVATVIGGPSDSPQSLRAVAGRCGTIEYEILTGLTRRLPRRYVGVGAG